MVIHTAHGDNGFNLELFAKTVKFLNKTDPSEVGLVGLQNHQVGFMRCCVRGIKSTFRWRKALHDPFLYMHHRPHFVIAVIGIGVH